MKKAIVIGGAGFIGSNLVALLLKKGWNVHVVDDFSVGKISNLPKNNRKLKISKTDIRNQKLMIKKIKNADIVFHLAVKGVRESINDPWSVHEVNVRGTLNVLDAALKNNIKKFVYVSSSEIYGTGYKVPMKENHPLNPTTIYGASKLAGEYYTLAYLRTYRLPVVIVRPFNTYGYNEHFEGPYGEVIPRFVVRSLNNLPLEIFGNGKQTRDFTFVTDTARGILAVGLKGKIGQIYNIARGQEVSINNLSELILKTLKIKGTIKYLPSRPGDVLRLYADSKKAEKELGFKTKVGIKKGLELYEKWFKKNFNSKEALKFYETKNW